MPGRNRTGPMGMGPVTGRGAGWCTGQAGQEIGSPPAGPGYGMRFGLGRGGGAGWRLGGGRGRGGGWRCGGYRVPYGYPGAHGTPQPEVEKQALANQAKALQAELDGIRQRLAEIDAEPADG